MLHASCIMFEETLDTVFYIMYNTAVERNTCFIDLLKNRYCKARRLRPTQVSGKYSAP